MEPSYLSGAAVAGADSHPREFPAGLPVDAEATQQLARQILLGM